MRQMASGLGQGRPLDGMLSGLEPVWHCQLGQPGGGDTTWRVIASRFSIEEDSSKRRRTTSVQGKSTMLPIVEVPETHPSRPGEIPSPVFCREAGFAHVSRYITGLILSPHKTLQGIYDLQVWGAAPGPPHACDA